MRKSYSQSFKLSAVKKVIVDGQSVSSTALAHGISPLTLKRWLHKYREMNASEDVSSENCEFLKKRLQEVTNERDTLRATIAILLKDEPARI